MADLYTDIYTFFKGRLVGEDFDGNRYYEESRPKRADVSARRWVKYSNKGVSMKNDASQVVPAYFSWLHGGVDEFPSEKNDKENRYFWQRKRIPNMTGTGKSLVPSGARLHSSNIEDSAAEYSAWHPSKKAK